MNNEVFWKALYVLSRPVSLGAIGALLINDHYLRRLWPSWLTGKIGDLAWLFFIPFVLAGVLAWLVPLRGRRQEKIVGRLAFGLTGTVFALAKTLPGFHDWLIRWTEGLLGSGVSLQRDPTDLVALVALVPSWWIWQRERIRPLRFSASGWIFFPLAALLTMANTAALNYGIDCLAVEDGHITAYSTLETFVSTDGGLAWEADGSGADTGCPSWAEEHGFQPSDPEYGIWQAEAVVTPASQAERAYYEKSRGGNATFEAGPLDAQTDPGTGNIIYAMGHEGVLVRSVDAQWRWVPVGPYRRARLDQTSPLLNLLYGEGVLALAFGLLCVSTLGLHLGRSCLKILPLAVGWGLWGVGLVVFPPALATGYTTVVVGMLLVALALTSVGVGLIALYRLYKSGPKTLVLSAATGLIGAPVFFLPFVLWALGGLSNYYTAVLSAMALGALVLLVGDRWVRGALR